MKLELWSTAWYYGGWPPLQNATRYNQGRVEYMWPATGSDTGSDKPCSRGGLYCGTNRHLAPGALVAVPPNVSNVVQRQLKTIIARKVLQALTDFGGYIVDDTGSQSGGAAICSEPAVIGELLRDYGISLNISAPVLPPTHRRDVSPSAVLYRDLVVVFRALHAVVNNGPRSVGGGGRRRRPPPPRICP